MLSAYAEALTLANGNKVPQAARLAFEQILQKTPDPRARYYVALAKAQAQDFEGAIEAWAALAREAHDRAAIVFAEDAEILAWLKSEAALQTR